jgi:hypothetical protein
VTTSSRDNESNVIRFAQTLLGQEDKANITPTKIEEIVERVLAFQPAWREGLDKAAVVDELIRRNSHWVGNDGVLSSDSGHVPWLDADRKVGWRYWQRYREWIEPSLSEAAVEALDRSTDRILGLLEDPVREGPWDRRGLVVGHVQSGKTGNYTGLICKAADAGYKVIIVLAGVHNNLRSQTQIRLDEGFLGYETKPGAVDLPPIGVGLIDSDPEIRPHYATNRLDNGDFSKAFAKNLGISPEERPWLFVVKKNKTVLELLNTWVRNRVANSQDTKTGRRVVTNLPLLIVDDEADHASVDTGEQAFDANGNPDPEHDPTTINRLIRSLLHSFSRSAYVGYTATPFANIYIHEKGATEQEGPDLFPAAFIINLGAPNYYIGPAKVFYRTDEPGIGNPFLKVIDDYCDETGKSGWMPNGHKAIHHPLYRGTDELPPSLKEAIHSFVLTCAVRRLRGQQNEHSSMLVHVTRFVAVQQTVFDQVSDYATQLARRISWKVADAAILAELESLWNSSFAPSSKAIAKALIDGPYFPDVSWDEVKSELEAVVQDIQVRMINGSAKDALDYSDQKDKGLKVIAIGGDKLSRGLTLEGLCTSYFLRASRMYDTLMQMGRWFGYRPGYLDLCRVYTTSELITWFRHIANASEELREEFDLMAARGGTPRDFGLKVLAHPVLMVTSKLKMRRARPLKLSFSGQLLETVAFPDKSALNKNLELFDKFIGQLGTPAEIPKRKRGTRNDTWKGHLWEKVGHSDVSSFLHDYRTSPDAHKVVSPLIAEFIGKMAAKQELREWTVALIGGGEGGKYSPTEETPIQMLQRTNSGDFSRFAIGRLLSSRDEALDFDEAEWLAALELTRAASQRDPARGQSKEPPDVPNGPAIRFVRGFGSEANHIPPRPDQGLLLLYVIDAQKSQFGADCPHIVAFGISFPGSHNGTTVDYMINNVGWELEYGAAS